MPNGMSLFCTNLFAHPVRYVSTPPTMNNQNCASAVAEKISALTTETYLAARGSADKFHATLAKVKNRHPLPGNELIP